MAKKKKENTEVIEETQEINEVNTEEVQETNSENNTEETPEENAIPESIDVQNLSIEEFLANPNPNISKHKQALIAYVWKLHCNGYTPMTIAIRACHYFKLPITPMQLVRGGYFRDLVNSIFKLEV